MPVLEAYLSRPFAHSPRAVAGGSSPSLFSPMQYFPECLEHPRGLSDFDARPRTNKRRKARATILSIFPNAWARLIRTSQPPNFPYYHCTILGPSFCVCSASPCPHPSHPPSSAIMSTRKAFADPTPVAGIDPGALCDAFSFVDSSKRRALSVLIRALRYLRGRTPLPRRHTRGAPLLQQAIAATSLTGSATAGQIFAFFGSKDTRRTGSAASSCPWSPSSWWTQAAAAPPSRVLCRCRAVHRVPLASRTAFVAVRSSWWTQAAAAPPSRVLCRCRGSSSLLAGRTGFVATVCAPPATSSWTRAGQPSRTIADGIRCIHNGWMLIVGDFDPYWDVTHRFRCLSITPGLAVSQCERRDAVDLDVVRHNPWQRYTLLKPRPAVIESWSDVFLDSLPAFLCVTLRSISSVVAPGYMEHRWAIVEARSSASTTSNWAPFRWRTPFSRCTTSSRVATRFKDAYLRTAPTSPAPMTPSSPSSCRRRSPLIFAPPIWECNERDSRVARRLGNPLIARLILGQNAQVQVGSYAPPNKHYLHPPDTRYFGAEVPILITAPSGLITATVTRK
ncbi:hypothetical protein B0H16DRAFT_1897059 [Mycena metata]|uniref:Uncharacterized protein n=1 Tax=Mycena metata TaxID=1033252 RepID=A0AAD7HGL3_9AGAR|nr:hypothetical protein B0H16DRAFT_1897059 [Mycena metata]